MQLTKAEILQEFEASQAILKGHFILSSGLRSDTYMQCARVLMNGKRSEKLFKALATKITEKLGEDFADIVVSPAMGGVIAGYELAKQLNLDAIFCERVDGEFMLRRGFKLEPGQRVLVVEDVITTGKSSLETFELIQGQGCQVVAEACLVDRSEHKNLDQTLKVPTISLLELEIKTFSEKNTPDELRNIEAIKPGSRFLK